MKIDGLAALQARLKKLKSDAEARVMAERRRAVEIIVRRLIENIPVWSGRTVRSIRVNNTGALASLEGPPKAADAAKFGQTRLMPLGSEPMRQVSDAMALSQVANADYDIQKPVHITIHSEAWGLVEQAEAPDKASARNKAVVSEIAKQAALAAVRSLRGGR